MSRKERPPCESEKDIFAERLTMAMRICAESQTSLAKKITERFVPIQRQTISLYMNGQSKPDTERLIAICKVLDVSADFLLGFTDCYETNLGIRATVDYTGLDELSISNLKSWVLQDKDAANELFDHRDFWYAMDTWMEWEKVEASLAKERDPNMIKDREIAADIAWCRMRRAFDQILSYNPHGYTITDPAPAYWRDLEHRLDKHIERSEENAQH